VTKLFETMSSLSGSDGCGLDAIQAHPWQTTNGRCLLQHPCPGILFGSAEAVEAGN
jgi:hypothetical protein